MPTLNWIGKEAVVDHHRRVPTRLLECDPALSVGDPEAGNLLVEGDNLEALKALLPRYRGKVKCIYIDPPYNTGNEGWIYNDNVNDPRIRKWLGEVVGKEAEDLCRHDKWLCMMYPRLALLREFLTEDGSILISIDDNELPRLQLVLDELFGAQNFVANLVWEKGKKGDAKFISVTHEYVVVFANNKKLQLERGVKWRRRKPGVEDVVGHYNEIRARLGNQHDVIRRELMAWYRSLPRGDARKAHKHYNWSDDRGLYFPDNFHGPDDGRESRPRYDILHPITGRPCAKPSTGWRWEEDRTERALAETPQRIHFGPDETTIPCRKSYLEEVNEEPFQSVFYTDGRAATLQVERLVGKGVFAFPKDVEVIANLISLVSDDDSIIMDSFAGSGSTGHAVLEQNKVDRGNRQFILVEMDEAVCRNVAARRLSGIVGELSSRETGGGRQDGQAAAGLGFRYCRLGRRLLDAQGNINGDVPFADLARYVYLLETGVPIPKRPRKDCPLLGVHQGRAVYLLFNGVLGDRRPAGGNVLTTRILADLPPHPDGKGPRVVYGEACRLGNATLKRDNVAFRQIPYSLREDSQ
jgi:adenine-specific DNA-methyltransferase